MSRKIFISYSRRDKDAVFKIVKEIENAIGQECWIDMEGIYSGSQFEDNIITAIDEADTVVFMMSQQSIAPYRDPHTGIVNPNRETYTRREVRYAIGRNKRLIPVSIDGTTVKDKNWLDFSCGGLDSIDYSQNDQKQKFLNNLKEWFGKPSTAKNYLKIKPNCDCEVFIDDKFAGKANTDVITKFPLQNGEYTLTCVSTKGERCFDLNEVVINNCDVLRKPIFAKAIEPKHDEQLLDFQVKHVKFNMVFVKGGDYQMKVEPENGRNTYDGLFMSIFNDTAKIKETERAEQNVTLDDFYIGEIPVTHALWKVVMGSTPTVLSRGKMNNDNPFELKDNEYPVKHMRWDNCLQFIENINQLLSHKLNGKRFAIPTETQWEYAAAGGNKSKGYIYSGGNNLEEVGWYWRNSGKNYIYETEYDWIKTKTNDCVPHPVARKRANELGIYDMSGNVKEWCIDCNKTDNEHQYDPLGVITSQLPVLRGGGFDSSEKECRITNRSKATNLQQAGLRLVLK